MEILFAFEKIQEPAYFSALHERGDYEQLRNRQTPQDIPEVVHVLHDSKY